MASAQDLSDRESAGLALEPCSHGRPSIAFASICELSVCATALYLYPHRGYALWLGAVLALLAVRLSLIAVCNRRSAHNAPTPTSAFLLASIAWSALLGLGTCCAM
ncbi:MAG: hypothetical protein WDN30_09125 [Pararobbsia sp.]